ncbi:16S rRNA processing protein RimM [Thiogranum longum]|uniref:Ribosome maturation factor RimM n=1 Tax=Thiogranum longum TaxID=1537524 RepID=A0A4R1HFE1_9GAMM|nr:16S rRNA processing protein RimM [Thiogranum longum]
MRGWVRVFSYTQPRENIVTYKPWFLRRDSGEWRETTLEEGRAHGKGVVARLADCTDRDQAQRLIGYEIGVDRNRLPVLPPGEYYWKDLIGLQVVNTQGDDFGKVDHLLETGANDVLVVKGDRERLIPFVMKQVIVEVNPDQGRILVDWDKEF